MVKLTEAQVTMLRECCAKTYGDSSGRGYVMMDGYMARTATSLHKRGLVSLPAGHGFYFNGLTGVKITDAGRAALSQQAPE